MEIKTTVAEELRKQISELGSVYWEGKENFFIRYWVYLNKGLDVFNQFKYYIGLPVAVAAVFPILREHLLLLGIVFLAGLPVLLLAGRYQMQKVNKTTEYVMAITSSIFQYRPMEMSIEQVELLKSINDKLDKLIAQKHG